MRQSTTKLPLAFTVLTPVATLGSHVQGLWGNLPDEWLEILDWGGESECTLLGNQCTLWVMCSWHTAVWSKRAVPPETDVTSRSLNSALGNTYWSCQFPRLWLSPNWLGLQSLGLAQIEDTAFLKGRKKEQRKDEIHSSISDSQKVPLSLIAEEQILSVFLGNLIEIWINKQIESDVTEDTSP